MKMRHEDKRYNRKSYQAINVANEVLNSIKQKKKINLFDIQVRNGYKVNSAKSYKVLQTKSFNDVVVPVLDKMRALHVKSIDALNKRNLDKERIDSVINLSKQMVHDTQLLSGKATENIANNVVVYGSDDFLALQVKQ